jgi:hypothetical protein
VAEALALRAHLPKLSCEKFSAAAVEAQRRRALRTLLEPFARGEASGHMTALDGGQATCGHDLRDQACELLRRIERQLGGLHQVDDESIASTVAECEQALAEIRTKLELEA